MYESSIILVDSIDMPPFLTSEDIAGFEAEYHSCLVFRKMSLFEYTFDYDRYLRCLIDHVYSDVNLRLGSF